MTTSGDVTRILRELRAGNRQALERLMPLVYDDLRERAEMHMRRERRNHTLTPTALINEAYLRLRKQRKLEWNDRVHFLAIASTQMRRVLLDHHKKWKKRKGDVPLSGINPQIDGKLLDEIAVAQALEKLAKEDERQARIADMRIFGKMTHEEIAEHLEISSRTVKREWNHAKAWLKRELGGGTSRGDTAK